MLLARIYESQAQGWVCWVHRGCKSSRPPARIIAFITEAGSIQRIFEYLGEPTQPPRIAPAARGPPDWEGDFDTREGEAFALSEPLPEYELDQR